MKQKIFSVWGLLVCLAALITACSNDDNSVIEGEGQWIIRPVEFSPVTRTLADNMTAAYVKYTADMIKYELSENPNTTHLVLSPISATMLLAQLANGVDEATQKEITGYLGTDDLETMNEMCRTILKELPKVDSNVSVDFANSLWTNSFYGISVDKNYLASYEKYFTGKDYKFDFVNDHDKLLKELKKWYSKNTGGLLTDPEQAFGPVFGEETLAIFLSSMYFKGSWDIFDENKTKKGVFHGITHDEMIDMMNSGKMQKSVYKDENFESFTLNFGNNAYYLRVILPSEALSLADAAELFSTELLDKIETQSERSILSVTMPKFNIKSVSLLNGALAEAGISSITNGDHYIMLENLPEGDKIMRLYQDVAFGISEKGAEVAAVSSGKLNIEYGSEMTGPEVHITVDRPFFYFIAEKTSNAWLTSGFVANLE